MFQSLNSFKPPLTFANNFFSLLFFFIIFFPNQSHKNLERLRNELEAAKKEAANESSGSRSGSRFGSFLGSLMGTAADKVFFFVLGSSSLISSTSNPNSVATIVTLKIYILGIGTKT